MRRLIFLGSKEIGAHCLQTLLKNQESLDIEVTAVFSNNRKLQDNSITVGQLAADNNIPIYTSLNDLETLPEVDFLVSVQYHEILKAKHIQKASKLAINLHMAPLPEYRGCNQFSFAIVDQAKTFGTTIHQLEEGIDSGSIIAETRFPITENETVYELYEKTVDASKELFDTQIKSILNGRFTPIPQHHLEAERGTSYHFRHEINQLKEIDLNWPEEQIDRFVRASYFPPFDPPYAIKDGVKIPLSHNWKEEIK